MSKTNNINQMYKELIRYYSNISLLPKRLVDKLILNEVKKGLSREEAIIRLYNEKIVKKKKGAKIIEEEHNLEKALEELKSRRYLMKTITTFFSFLMIILIFIIFMGNPYLMLHSGFLIFFFIFLLMTIISIFSRTKTEWIFNEEFLIKGAGKYIDDIIENTPSIFQEIILQNISYRREDNTLLLNMFLERSILERVKDVENARLVDLGEFHIKAIFNKVGNDLIIRASYYGRPPSGYSDIAAEMYERIITAFKSAVRESFERVKPKKVFTIDFVELAKLISSTGIIVKAIRCPNCGANIELPKKGDVMKCPYCNVTIKAIDVYDMIKKLLEEIKE